MGSIGDCYDSAMIESFWGRMQTELLNCRKWRARLELANTIFENLDLSQPPARPLRARHAHPNRIRAAPQQDQARSMSSQSSIPTPGNPGHISLIPGRTQSHACTAEVLRGEPVHSSPGSGRRCGTGHMMLPFLLTG